jgi:hypothetical protein
MTWIKALKWATPFWIATIGTIGISMFCTDFATDVGTPEALKRLCLAALVGLPLIAFSIRATVDDVVRFRAAFPKKGADEGQR